MILRAERTVRTFVRGWQVTINLLLGAMERARQERGARRFLIDGFPRNAENRDAWEATAGYDCEFVLFFVASQETLEKRLTSRKEGRSDDNSDTIRGRFKTFMESSLPVIQHYEKKGKVARIQADGSPEEVYSLTIPFFEPFVKVRLGFNCSVAKRVDYLPLKHARSTRFCRRRGGCWQA